MGYFYPKSASRNHICYPKWGFIEEKKIYSIVDRNQIRNVC